jgi:hypothetical protein
MVLVYKIDEILSGEQPAIVDKSLFEAVQQKLSAHQSHKTLTRQKSDHLLKGLLFDDAGHRMIATHALACAIAIMFLNPAYTAKSERPGSDRYPGSPLLRSSKRSSQRFENPSPSKTQVLPIETILSNSTMLSSQHSSRASRFREPNWSCY